MNLYKPKNNKFQDNISLSTIKNSSKVSNQARISSNEDEILCELPNPEINDQAYRNQIH